eukprot:CAMPEP_0175055516 /NCGR_PEP_ID=MMETSP0052_2-20121109/10128_1 /TAXON_ID=51329 ORGANISM="Polytomella parva, Strain SAG 63-3" /NCGR_SAMPLE_ID=MMETSP0052_2 /ASSEMBLY_ACC=CAM_ASM_000194 /LENGTH=372 /DNA_ID=CAMNT_0016320379 /DNA_START=46 /DNA_END=1164 /DNA_ORIENTATION=+
MAKIGEGDPRWLVEERKDGRNVNNWHWTETDCLEWSKKRLSEIFTDTTILNGSSGPYCKTTGVDSVTGEAFINIRKQKLIPSYELEIKIKWEGEIREENGEKKGEAKGFIHFPYVADENHDEEAEMRVACESNDEVSKTLKSSILESKTKKVIYEMLNKFVEELRSGIPARRPNPASATSAKNDADSSSSEAEPAANGAADSKDKAAREQAATKAKAASAAALSKKNSTSSHSKSLSFTEKFYARPKDIFDCFTLEPKMCAFTQSKCVADLKAGGKFSWFSGNVVGEFLEVTVPSKIVMKWRFSSWEDDTFSNVEISISEPEHGTTILTLRQTGIPETDRFGNHDVVNVAENGWKGQIFFKIRAVFGYGLGL